MPGNSAASAKDSSFFPIVGIGASAGGLEALTQLLKYLPADTGMGFVVVQHLAPQHQSLLTELLSRATRIPVTEVTDGKQVEANHVYVIPPNTDMAISNGVLRLKRREASTGLHLPVDYFLTCLAEDRGNKAIGVILSGSASDGTLGLKAIKAEGGITFAQEEKSAKFDSMPHSAIAAGYADFVLSPRGIAQELARIGRHPYLSPAEPVQAEETAPMPPGGLNRVFALLREANGVDFGQYKQTTITRRIKRRMVLRNIKHLQDYVRSLESNRGEVEALYRDMLISVTAFFREPEVFEALKRKVFPKLMAGRSPDPLRIWVPGCSTGEEAYSIAICALEFLAAVKSEPGIQIFATDISDGALEQARLGRYTESEVSGISPERLQRFFIKVNGDYQIGKSMREMCVFARQNVIKDPPFSRLDLISCRNLLIYLDKALQRKLMPIFHYALGPGGFLMLGRSESISEFTELFSLVDKKNKIYSRKSKPAKGRVDLRVVEPALKSPATIVPRAHIPAEFDLQREINRVLLAEHTPPCIVVNEELEIVQFHGHTGPYLDPKPGAASLRLLKMARAGLPMELRTAIHQAQQSNQPVVKKNVRVSSNGQSRKINIEVKPFNALPSGQCYFLVLFQEPPAQEAPLPPGSAAKEALDRDENLELRRDLDQAQDELQGIIDQLESSNEQLRAANEEIQSNNEELQTANEELETSKEELQAANEELSTLNEELQNRNVELTTANNDVNNMISNIMLPMVILGNDLRIRRFTPGAEKVFSLIPGDVGRPITDLRPAIDFPDLDKFVSEAIEKAIDRRQEVTDRRGRWYSLLVRPYKTAENRVEGAVLTLMDIDELKSEAAESRNYAEAIVQTVRDAFLVLDSDLKVKTADRTFYEHFAVSPLETEGRILHELGNGQWNAPRLLDALTRILPEKTELRDFELSHDFPAIGRRTMLLNARQIRETRGLGPLILLAIQDITDLSRTRQVVEEQSKLLDLANDVIIVRDLSGVIKSWNSGAERTYGWTREEALGKITHDLLKTEPREILEERRRKLADEGTWEGELTHEARDGMKLLVASRQVVHRGDQGQIVVLEINRDVTAQKQSEQAIRQLSGRILKLQDEERRKIARDLHDSTAQTLSALALNLALVKTMAAGTAGPALAKTLTESEALAKQASDEIRNLAHLLHPPDLDSVGLGAAVRWFASRFAERTGIRVNVELPPNLGRLPQQEFETALFRVVQESLTNVQRHSGSQDAMIRLLREDNYIILEVEDHGHGMPSDFLTDGKTLNVGVGVAGMQERLRDLGGYLKLISTSTGTTVKAAVP